MQKFACIGVAVAGQKFCLSNFPNISGLKSAKFIFYYLQKHYVVK